MDSLESKWKDVYGKKTVVCINIASTYYVMEETEKAYIKDIMENYIHDNIFTRDNEDNLKEWYDYHGDEEMLKILLETGYVVVIYIPVPHGLELKDVLFPESFKGPAKACFD